jgi:hypothetical protein
MTFNGQWVLVEGGRGWRKRNESTPPRKKVGEMGVMCVPQKGVRVGVVGGVRQGVGVQWAG